jgi:cytochrome c oxidase cbb3-type subunit III
MSGPRGVILVPLSVAIVAALACERETRRYHEIPAASTRAEGVAQTPLRPGGAALGGPTLSPYQENAYGLSEGKRLYAAFNCNGCHMNGGGGIGPALMDDKWIYGAEPEQIYSTIVEGRTNGMPAFGARVPSQQVWQLVGYVQSLSGQVPRDAAPGRNDSMSIGKPELRIERVEPKQTGHR